MKCYFCGKTSVVGNCRIKLRGKFNPTEKKRKYPNIQWTKLASGKRVKSCVRCIKTQAKGK